MPCTSYLKYYVEMLEARSSMGGAERERKAGCSWGMGENERSKGENCYVR